MFGFLIFAEQGATPITLDAPKDTVRLKKHISSVMDRVSKGGRISDARNVMGGEETNQRLPTDIFYKWYI